MASPFHLLGFAGSLRAQSNSRSILDTLADAVLPRAIFEIADIGALPFYDEDLERGALPATVVALRDQIARADGIVLVAPEFNHGIPGVLKNALDWGSRPAFRSPFRGKPALLVTHSHAFTGGVRAQYQLRETIASMLARPVTTSEIVIGQAHLKIADGRFTDQGTINYALKGFEALFDEILLLRRADGAPCSADMAYSHALERRRLCDHIDD